MFLKIIISSTKFEEIEILSDFLDLRNCKIIFFIWKNDYMYLPYLILWNSSKNLEYLFSGALYNKWELKKCALELYFFLNKSWRHNIHVFTSNSFCFKFRDQDPRFKSVIYECS